jgi:hypothetical protein
MRGALVWSCCLLLFAASLAGDDHQTARAFVSVGADLEILDRAVPDMAVLNNSSGYTSEEMEPEVETPAATRLAEAEMVALDIAYGLWGRAHARAVASNSSARAEARAYPGFDLVNISDNPISLRVRVRIPGALPIPGGLSPNPYELSGEVDSNWAEVASTRQQVAVWASPDIGGTPGYILNVDRRNRAPIPPPGLPDGPVHFDAIGVPFTRDFTITVPSGFHVTETDSEIIIEVVVESMGLWVFAEAEALSILEGTAQAPVKFAEPERCDLFRPRPPFPVGFPDRDRLCSVIGAGSPVCSCLRDPRHNQRCSFTLEDLFVTQELVSPALAGETVHLEWSVLPWMTGDGEFTLRAEIFANGKWMPIAVKEKLGGKLKDGKDAKAKASFTMPSHPTIVRTRMTHLAKGAKQPVESEIRTMVALRKPKGQGK